MGFQLKLQSAVFGMIIISFYCKYSAKIFYMFQYGYRILFSFYFECVLNSFENSMLAFVWKQWKMSFDSVTSVLTDAC